MAKKLLRNNEFLLASLLIIIGGCLVIFKSDLVGVMFTIIGASLVILGAYDIYKKETTKGLIELIVGIVIIVCGWAIFKVAVIILGVVFAGRGLHYLASQGPKMAKAKGLDKILSILKPLLMVVFGVILIVAPWVAVDIMNILFIIAGVVIIIDGVVVLIPALSK